MSAAPKSRYPLVGSLCSGYGGLDMGLALVYPDLRVAWHVENDGVSKKGELVGPKRLLAHRFPDVPNYGDVKTTDWHAVQPVEWLTAGYPCQPFSAAGKRLGAADERHLWPFVATAIGALRPRHVLLENVRGHVGRGLDTVIGDLSGLGYDARWRVVRASDAGAPHQRERVFIVAADATSDGRDEGRAEPAGVIGGLHAAERGPAPAPDSGGARLGEQPGGAPAEEARTNPGDELADHRGPRAAEVWGPYLPAIARWERVTGRPAPGATEPRGRGGAQRLESSLPSSG